MDKHPRQEADTQTGYIEVKRQTSNLRLRWEWAEPTIWTDKMLTALENGVKGGKWFSLIDKIYSKSTLYLAWQKVRKNKGAAGVDAISIERFTAKEEKYLQELHIEIREGTYKPNAVKRVYIPKGKGKTRPLGIPTVKDRIAQQAVKLVIEPIFEKIFIDSSYGFRPNKGAKDALREVDRLLKEGYNWVVDADLASYFDTIPHDNLMGKVRNHISDKNLLGLIDKWLNQEIFEETKSWTPIQGTPQGAVLSPLLANLYLHDLDVQITNHDLKIVRYADDFVILTKSQKDAKIAMDLIQKWTEGNGLTIHPEKTHVCNWLVEEEGFDFLGYRFENGKKWIRHKSIMSFRDKVRMKTKRNCGKSIEKVIEDLNRTLKGWYNYFKHVSKYGLGTFDSFVRRRLRSILRSQNKRPGYGRTIKDHTTWPNSYFANLGLFSMEDARRREVACRSR